MTGEVENKSPAPNAVIELLKASELSAIQLVSSEFYIRVPAEQLNSDRVEIGATYDFSSAIQAQEEKKPREIFCFLTTNLIAKIKESDPLFKTLENGQAFGGVATFVVRYTLNSDLAVAQNTLDLLARNQAFFIAYPYIRHFFDQQFSFMGIKGVTLPLLRTELIKPTENKK